MPKHEIPSPELNSARFKRNGIQENEASVGTKRSLDGLISWLSTHDAVINSVVERNVPGTLVKTLFTQVAEEDCLRHARLSQGT